MILTEWLNATGMTAIAGSPKKGLAYFDPRPKEREKKQSSSFL